MTKAKNPKYTRLSDALRQNLLKRKEQQRNRLQDKDQNNLNTALDKIEEKNKEGSSEDQGEKE